MLMRGALLSKAIFSISIVAFFLNYFELLSESRNIQWLVLLGAAMFVAGAGISYAKSTPEFKSGRTIPLAVSEMKQITDIDFASSRIKMLGSLIDRFKLSPPRDLPRSELINAQRRFAKWSNSALDAKSLEGIGGLYDADLRLRQYDNFAARMICAPLFLTGMALMALPTIVNLFSIIFR